MRRQRYGVGLSFLDMICSAMGGTLLLAVLFSIVKNPVAMPTRDDFIIVEVKYANANVVPGIEIRHDSGAVQSFPARQSLIAYDRKIDDSAVFVSHGIIQPTESGVGIMVVWMPKPKNGDWRFRPYLYDFPPKALESLKIRGIRAWNKSGEIVGEWSTLATDIQDAGQQTLVEVKLTIEG
jgi:hypothetical protein